MGAAPAFPSPNPQSLANSLQILQAIGTHGRVGTALPSVAGYLVLVRSLAAIIAKAWRNRPPTSATMASENGRLRRTEASNVAQTCKKVMGMLPAGMVGMRGMMCRWRCLTPSAYKPK